MNTHGATLPVLLGGPLAPGRRALPTEAPPPDRVAAISPLAQIRAANYATPTFLIHPRDDDLIPWRQAERTWLALRDKLGGQGAELRILDDVPHLFDLYPLYRSRGQAVEAVRDGYRFLARYAGVEWCE